MYVCLCNALTDADIRQAATQRGAQRPAEVFAACRCRAQCGTCVRTVCALIGVCLRQPGDRQTPDDPLRQRAEIAA